MLTTIIPIAILPSLGKRYSGMKEGAFSNNPFLQNKRLRERWCRASMLTRIACLALNQAAMWGRVFWRWPPCGP
jgi:hypothetical protein